VIRSFTRALTSVVVICAVTAGLVAVAAPAGSVVVSCPGTGSTFSGGSGTTADPYRIASATQLASIDTVSGGYLNCSFLQTADISLASIPNWTPIGSIAQQGFGGEYDGGGFRIDDVTITGGGGLFNFAASASFKHLHLEVSVTGSNNVGGLVGAAQFTTIDDVHVTATLVDTGTATGIIVGQFTYGTISRSSGRGSVTTTAYGGGLVGMLSFGAISDSYSRATVTGGLYVGGLVGQVFACCGSSPQLNRSFATGTVTGSTNLGGLVGILSVAGGTSFTNTASFWDSQTTGRSTSDGGGTARTTLQMKDLTTFSGSNWNITAGYDPAQVWGMCSLSNDGYPFLQIESGGIDPCTAPVVVPAPTVGAPPSTIVSADDPVIPVFTG